MKSLNIVYPEKRKVELLSMDVPALKPGEVLCKTVKSLISTGTETICLNGEFDPDTNWYGWVKYPFQPGYSLSCVVVEVGDGVTSLKAGDRVMSEQTHMQYFTAPEASLIKIPDGVTDEQATWVALMRVAQNAVRKGQIQMGDTVVLIGAGQVGLLALQFIRVCGATRIIVIDPIASRAELALQCGATDVITAMVGDAVEKVRELTGGKMADVVCEATGHPLVLAPACKLARRYGKIILVGDTSLPSKQALGPGVVANSLTILGAHGSMTAAFDNPFYPWTWRSVNEISLTYLMQGRIRVDPLISHRITPQEAPAMYMQILDDRSKAVGVIIDWTALD